MIVRAVGRGLKASPRKMGEVAALVRGRTVNDAVAILDHTPRRAARLLKKLITSAQANAKSNHNLAGELLIARLLVGPGPVLKRWRVHARLNVRPVRRRLSNVTVELEPAPDKSAASARQPKSAARSK